MDIMFFRFVNNIVQLPDHKVCQPKSGDITFGRYKINAAQLLDYDFNCEPKKCQEKDAYCCARFEVDLTGVEAARVAGLMPTAAGYCDGLTDEDGVLINPFDEEQGEISLDKNDDGDCVFTFVDESKGEKFCALHTACLDLGLNPSLEKPLPCSIWPLFVGDGDEDENGKKLIGLDLDSDPVCLTKKKLGDKKISDGVKELLIGIFKENVEAVIAEIESRG